MSGEDETEVQDNNDEREFDEDNAYNCAAKLKKIRAELQACQKEKSEYLAGWQRAKADFINARKEEERQRIEVVKFASERIAYEILAVADSMEMALANAPPDWLKHLYAQLMETFRRHGITAIESVGQHFYPTKHEAMQEEISDQDHDNTILEEYQKGYMMHDKVLRPAKVKVGIYKAKIDQ